MTYLRERHQEGAPALAAKDQPDNFRKYILTSSANESSLGPAGRCRKEDIDSDIRGREGGRKGVRERERGGEREGGREGGRKGGRERDQDLVLINVIITEIEGVCMCARGRERRRAGKRGGERDNRRKTEGVHATERDRERKSALLGEYHNQRER